MCLPVGKRQPRIPASSSSKNYTQPPGGLWRQEERSPAVVEIPLATYMVLYTKETLHYAHSD